jgi:hypothetical protein
MGAIGETGSLLLRVNRNCPWNRCLFCPVYKNERFSTRSVADLKRDIDAVKRTRDLIYSEDQGRGDEETISPDLLHEVVSGNPSIYGVLRTQPKPEQRAARSCLSHTAGWLYNGAKRVFLQDADALAMKVSDLVEILEYLKRVFPTIDTITCYARAKSCERRSVEELTALKHAGLSWCFIGVESGCDTVLGYMNKGVTGTEHIEAGEKLRQAGIDVAAFVMPGLGGRDPLLSRKHILDTVHVLNRMQPNEVRVRSLAVLESSLLYRRWQSGEFIAPSEDQLVEELSALINGIGFECTIETLQMTNPVINIKGPIGIRRESALKQLEEYQALSPVDRARFNLKRYVGGQYLEFVDDWGKFDQALETLIQHACESAKTNAPDALELADKAIFTLKSKGIP